MSGDRAASFERGESSVRVLLESGKVVEADSVVAGVGVVPNVGLFEGNTVGIDDGIVVDEFLQTSIPGVCAAGDVARYHDVLSGTGRRVEHWDNAKAQGEYWARAMMQKDSAAQHVPFKHVPYFFSDTFDLSWEFWGDRRGSDHFAVRGKIAEGQFSMWWLKDDKLIGAFVMNRPDEEREAAHELIRWGPRISVKELETKPSLLELTTAET
jgi:hypothetical protein